VSEAAKALRIEIEGRIAQVHLCTGRASNALSFDAMHELTEAARWLAARTDINAVVLQALPQVFTGGFDLKEVQALGEMPLSDRRQALAIGPQMCEAWQRIEALTIAAIDGWCVGGGVALVAACDLRVASAAAHFCVPEVERGLNMSWGSLPRLVNLVGAAHAKRLVMLAEPLDAPTAQRWGLIDEVSTEPSAVAQAQQWAQRAAAMPPIQLRMIKAGIDAYANALAPAASALDRDQFLLASLTQDHAEGLQSFLEKRPSSFRGR
jgi:enoyl-CoA hydratase/carnithine racemase